jgi:hypothetical protein
VATVSILTCVLGEQPEVFRTQDSLQSHLSPSFRWVIKFTEGVSDAFLARLARPYITCHRQLDRGLYDAMNQGLALLDTDYYFVLGAGDQLHAPGAQALLPLLASAQLEPAYFAALIHTAQRSVLMPAPEEIHSRMACPHPSSVLRVDNSRKIGGFDERYMIASDYDHLCRYVHQFGRGRTIAEPLVLYAGGGLSERRALEGMLEEELIRLRIWQSGDLVTQARLLVRAAGYAASVLNHVSASLKNQRG